MYTSRVEFVLFEFEFSRVCFSNASSEFERVWGFLSTTVDKSGSSSSRDSVTTLLRTIQAFTKCIRVQVKVASLQNEIMRYYVL